MKHLDIAVTLAAGFYKRRTGMAQIKIKGIEAAKYNWILSIDGDEVPDHELINSTTARINA